MKPRIGAFRAVVSIVATGFAVLAVQAVPAVTSIPLTGYGDAFGNSMSAPLPLSPSALLLAVEGPDGAVSTADDVVLQVTGIGGTPVVTPLATPYLAGPSGRLVRLSATRAVTTGYGADGLKATADDVLLVLDGIGGAAPTVTPIVVGFLEATNYSAPTALSASSVVLSTRGADAVVKTADDEVALVTGIGGTPLVDTLPAPYLQNSARSRPVALSPGSFAVASEGPDAATATADDTVYVFLDAGGANTRVDVVAPKIAYGQPGRPVRLSADRLLVGGLGADGSASTADDEVHLLDHLGTTPVVTSLPVPYIHDYMAGQPVALGTDTAAVTTMGPGGGQDQGDTVAVLTGLGAGNVVTQVVVGPTEEDSECKVLRLRPSRIAVVTFGADNSNNNADDELTVVEGVGGANAVSHVTIGAVQGRASSEPRAVDGSTVAVSTGGPDDTIDSGSDDVISVVSGIGGTPVVDTVPMIGEASDGSSLASVPEPLGGGRAAFVSSGPDNTLGSGGDDALRIVDAMPSARSLFVKKMALGFRESAPEKGEKASLSGTLALDGENAFGEGDLTVSLGNAAQTVPAGDFVVKKGNWTYSDPKGLKGFVRKISFKGKTGKISIKAKGVSTGIETTGEEFMAAALDFGHLYLSFSGTGTSTNGGLKYRAPKELR